MIATAVLACTVAAAGAPPVSVHGESRCPTASQVAALLPELLPPSGAANPGIAWIESVGLDLQIEVRSPSGEVRFSRRLTSSGTCADLATIAAVVIASWSAEQNPDVSLLQPGVLAPAKPRQPSIASIASPANPPAANRQAGLAAPAATRAFDLAAAVGGSANSAGVVGVARAESGLRWRRFGLRLGVTAETERSQTIEPGSVSWRRYALSLGPTFAVVQSPLMVEARADIFAGLTTVDGYDYTLNGHSRAMAVGLAGALRVGRGSGRVRPWLEDRWPILASRPTDHRHQAAAGREDVTAQRGRPAAPRRQRDAVALKGFDRCSR